MSNDARSIQQVSQDLEDRFQKLWALLSDAENGLSIERVGEARELVQALYRDKNSMSVYAEHLERLAQDAMEMVTQAVTEANNALYKSEMYKERGELLASHHIAQRLADTGAITAGQAQLALDYLLDKELAEVGDVPVLVAEVLRDLADMVARDRGYEDSADYVGGEDIA